MISDWRSDTVTLPTAAMKAVMMDAPLGDDVMGEDPSINALEAKAAELFGMEAALFCPSGTMTNQIAVNLHTNAPCEIIIDQLSHIYNYEVGGAAFNSGASLRLAAGDRGMFTAEMAAQLINKDDVHLPETAMIAVENTSNRGGGACYDPHELEKLSALCQQHGLPFHLDGARLFNAIVARGESTLDYGLMFDSISICLSKGLGAPVGSLLLTSEKLIRRARRIRKAWGGGMRQAGMLAAAGSYALDHHVDRLSEDHQRAQQVGVALSSCAAIQEVYPVETNIVVAELTPATDRSALMQKLADRNVLIVPFGPNGIRFVAHLDLTDDHLEHTISAIAAL